MLSPKIEGKFSTWEELLTGVPQGLVSGPLLFIIYPNDLFYAVKYADISNFSGDTTPHCSSTKINEAIINLEHEFTLLVEWFRDNCMMLNASECHLLHTERCRSYRSYKYIFLLRTINHYVTHIMCTLS